MSEATTRAEEGEHPTNDTLERIGAVGRSCKVGKHQATNWVHLRATVDALDAAGHHEAADTLIWQVWHRVNSRARYQEFYNLGRAAEDAAESRAASAEAEVERLTGLLKEATVIAECRVSAASDAEYWADHAKAAEASASALRDRVAVLESALKPFVRHAELYADWLRKSIAPNPLNEHYEAARAALNGGSDA